MLGSVDLQSALESIATSRGFNDDPWKLPTSERGDAFMFNDVVAKRHVYQILTARLLVFERFLEVAREVRPAASLNGLKLHWLHLQLCSEGIFSGVDLFARISSLLGDASDEFLLMGGRKLQYRLVDLRTRFDLDIEFFLILDEAQVALNFLPDSFCSYSNNELKRPVLSPIVDTFSRSASFPAIVSGTDLSINVVNDVVNASVGGGEEFLLKIPTDAFDDKESQRKYIMRYMPRHIAQTDSGEALIERAWNFARGRWVYVYSQHDAR